MDEFKVETDDWPWVKVSIFDDLIGTDEKSLNLKAVKRDALFL